MKGFILTLCVLSLFAVFAPTAQAGLAPPDQIEIVMPMPKELSALEQSLDDLACRGRLIRGIGRGLRGVGRALVPGRHHR